MKIDVNVPGRLIIEIEERDYDFKSGSSIYYPRLYLAAKNGDMDIPIWEGKPIKTWPQDGYGYVSADEAQVLSAVEEYVANRLSTLFSKDDDWMTIGEEGNNSSLDSYYLSDKPSD